MAPRRKTSKSAKRVRKVEAPAKAATVSVPPSPPPADPARPMIPPSERRELILYGAADAAARAAGVTVEELIEEEMVREHEAWNEATPLTVVGLATASGAVMTDLALPGNRLIYLRTLERCGRHEDACAALGLEPRIAYGERRRDPMFAHKCDVAIGMFASRVRRALVRRATEGWVEPVIGGKDRDTIVAWKPVYSDRLLELLAKSLDKDLRAADGKGGASVQVGVGVNVTGGGGQGITLDQLRALSDKGRAALRTVLAELSTKPPIEATASEAARGAE